jgi:predicted Rossmann fold flavoprotein
MNIAIIGGGAAGFFAAINCAENFREHNVYIFEKSSKVLTKVKISGGGRCNVTHACFDNNRLTEFFPRGNRELKNAFSRFSTVDTVKWFENRNVKLKAEADGRMFPVTDNSGTIIHCLLNEAEKFSVRIMFNHSVQKIIKLEKKFELHFQSGEQKLFDRVLITTGGNPSVKSYQWLAELGHTINSPVPSLFTFNIPSSPLKGLEGISANILIKLPEFKFDSYGPLLITHWGISGPAVLRLSSFAARWLHEKDYRTNCIINWLPEMKEESVREKLIEVKGGNPNKNFSSLNFQGLPSRLWQRLCIISGVDMDEKCNQVNKSKINKLVQNCCNFQLAIMGKTTFKEEFVTCGGVTLKEVNMQTMESKIVEGLFFAGEVLDIDGVTGGFNFQAAWTTGYLAGINAGKKLY